MNQAVDVGMDTSMSPFRYRHLEYLNEQTVRRHYRTSPWNPHTSVAASSQLTRQEPSSDDLSIAVPHHAGKTGPFPTFPVDSHQASQQNPTTPSRPAGRRAHRRVPYAST